MYCMYISVWMHCAFLFQWQRNIFFFFKIQIYVGLRNRFQNQLVEIVDINLVKLLMVGKLIGSDQSQT